MELPLNERPTHPASSLRLDRATLHARSAGLLLCGGAFILESLLYRKFTAEDAYIVLRYARNAASAGELSFNLGERISALTSPLHALTEVVLFKLFGAALVPYKWLGVGLVLGTLLFTLRVHRARPTVQLLAALVFVAPWMALWTVGGLETPILIGLIGILAALVTSRTDGLYSRLEVVGIHFVAGLAFLTRYDSILFTGPVLLASWVVVRDRRTVILSILAGALVPACWLLFAKLHYGSPLPTSFYVKRPLWTPRVLARNVVYLSAFGLLTLLFPFAWSSLHNLKRRWREYEKDHRTLLAGLVVGLMLEGTYALSTATTHMMFGGRLLVPYLLPAAISVGTLFTNSRLLLLLRDRPLVLVIPGLLFHGAHASYVQAKSLNGLLPVGEYRNEGVSSYAGTFLPGLARNGRAIAEDWSRVDARRAPRIFTFAGGVLPYELADAYVMEQLVSYPWFASYDVEALLRCVDYVHILTPRHGSVAAQLGASAGSMRLVARETLTFDGVPENFEVYAPKRGPRPGATMEDCMSDDGPAR